MAVIVRHQSEDPVPNTGCAYSVRIDSQTAKCMTDVEYQNYKQAKVDEAARMQAEADKLQPFVGGFIALVLAAIVVISYFSTE